jgi:hypothetical protein
MSVRIFEKIEKFMEKCGIPGHDLYDLPSSEKTFPDGANYRMEIAGVERASSMEALFDEMIKGILPSIVLLQRLGVRPIVISKS